MGRLTDEEYGVLRAIRYLALRNRRDAALSRAIKAARKLGYTVDESAVGKQGPPLPGRAGVCAAYAQIAEKPQEAYLSACFSGHWEVWGIDASGEYFSVEGRSKRQQVSLQEAVELAQKWAEEGILS